MITKNDKLQVHLCERSNPVNLKISRFRVLANDLLKKLQIYKIETPLSIQRRFNSFGKSLEPALLDVRSAFGSGVYLIQPAPLEVVRT